MVSILFELYDIPMLEYKKSCCRIVSYCKKSIYLLQFFVIEKALYMMYSIDMEALTTQ